MTDKSPKNEKTKRGGLVTGLILLGIGVIFLLDSFRIFYIGDSWPLLLVVIGLSLIVGALRRDSSDAPPAQ